MAEMSGEMDIVTYHCEGPIERAIDDARELVYSDVSTLPSFLKHRHPTLSDDLCNRIVKNVVGIVLEELEEKT